MKKLLLILLCLPIIGFGQEKSNHWNAIFNSGLENKKLKNYSLAIELFTKILLESPYDKVLYSQTYCNRGNTFAAMNQIQDAFNDYNLSIEIDINYALPYANRGYLKSQNGIRFCDDFKKACELGNKKTCKWYTDDKCDERNGQEIFRYSNGDMYEGEYGYDTKEGKGTFTHVNGNKYVGEWKDDKKHGIGTLTWAGGGKYVGEWRDGKRTGKGTYTWVSGGKYVGEFNDGKQDGQGTYTKADGTVKQGLWRNGTFLGE